MKGKSYRYYRYYRDYSNYRGYRNYRKKNLKTKKLKNLETKNSHSSQPVLRIEKSLAAPELEVEVVVADAAQRLARRHTLARTDTHRDQIAIDRDILAVTDHHHHGSAGIEDGTHHAVEDGTRLRPTLTLKVDALVVQSHT